jgi:hypothetical protein
MDRGAEKAATTGSSSDINDSSNRGPKGTVRDPSEDMHPILGRVRAGEGGDLCLFDKIPLSFTDS